MAETEPKLPSVSAGVQTLEVTLDEDGMRLDRWFRKRFPGLGHGRLEKLLRTGQVRLDGGRAKSNVRVAAGQSVRVPPLGGDVSEPPRPPARPKPISEHEAEDLRARVLYRDGDLLAIDKPAGLAVQGGSGTERHLDGMLDALAFDATERPRLVHRLDKDTSGILLLARSAESARVLTEQFRSHETLKVYWAIVVGVPKIAAGRISMPVAKLPGPAGERMAADDEEGKRAVTDYMILDKALKRAAWLAMAPRTGRTHQLRVHCASALGTPILGDGKYGGAEAFLGGGGFARQIHLHARAIRIPRGSRAAIELTAPAPPHFLAAMLFLGFEAGTAGDPFAPFLALDS